MIPLPDGSKPRPHGCPPAQPDPPPCPDCCDREHACPLSRPRGCNHDQPLTSFRPKRDERGDAGAPALLERQNGEQPRAAPRSARSSTNEPGATSGPDTQRSSHAGKSLSGFLDFFLLVFFVAFLVLEPHELAQLVVFRVRIVRVFFFVAFQLLAFTQVMMLREYGIHVTTFIEATVAYALKRPELAKELRPVLQRLLSS